MSLLLYTKVYFGHHLCCSREGEDSIHSLTPASKDMFAVSIIVFVCVFFVCFRFRENFSPNAVGITR